MSFKRKILPPSLEKIQKIIDLQFPISQVKDIALQGCKIEIEETELLEVALSDSKFRVESLCFNKNAFPLLDCLERVVNSLSMSTSLKKILFIRCNLGPNLCSLLAKGLAHNNSITSVDLTGNKIGDDGARSIASLISSKSRITIFNLNDNNISYAIGNIVESLRRNVFVIQMSLSYNKELEEGYDMQKQLLKRLISRNNTAQLIWPSFSLFMLIKRNSVTNQDPSYSLNLDVLSVIYNYFLSLEAGATTYVRQTSVVTWSSFH